jgi:nicotinate-nucleotide adenylyltransferase
LKPAAAPYRRRRRKIGLLGGSFNPAHEGHRHISLLALKALGLDELWWLVSPQNPLKPVAGMAPLDERIARAERVARHRLIKVTGIEAAFGTRFTADPLRALRRRFPQHRFVWIMGADNLRQISRWRDWTRIFATVPVAVFDRPTYSYGALASKAAHRYARDRIALRLARRLADQALPAWVFVQIARHPASATELRAKLAKLVRKPSALHRSFTPSLASPVDQPQ